MLRLCGLRAGDLDGVALAYLDSWARAQAKVEMMDNWTALHEGWLDDAGNAPPFVLTYFAAINSARLAMNALATHLRSVKSPVVIDLSKYQPDKSSR